MKIILSSTGENLGVQSFCDETVILVRFWPCHCVYPSIQIKSVIYISLFPSLSEMNASFEPSFEIVGLKSIHLFFVNCVILELNISEIKMS